MYFDPIFLAVYLSNFYLIGGTYLFTQVLLDPRSFLQSKFTFAEFFADLKGQLFL